VTAAERLVVAANRRAYKFGTTFCAVGAAVGLIGAPTETSTTRIGLYLCGIVFTGGFVLGLLRLRMAKFPQLVADDDGFTVVTLFTRRSFAWADLQQVEDTFYAGPLGKQRSKPRIFGNPITEYAKLFRLRARGRLYAVMSPRSFTADDLDDIREKFVRMWHQHAPRTP
jgi:hypothetical protein